MTAKYLQPKERNVQTYEINAFDVETTGDKNRFYMGSIVGDNTINDDPEVYWDKDEMLDALLSRRFANKRIYATNLEFDLLTVLDKDRLENEGYDVEIFHNGSSIIWGKIRDGNERTWQFRDTYNIAPRFSVEIMGDILGLPKLNDELGIDFSTFDAKDYDKDVMEKYNIRDSEITYEFVKWFQNELSELGGELQTTAASIAMNFFRMNYLDRAIERPPVNLLEDYAYEGYYGGRVSPFVKGRIEGPVYGFDVASLYPYAMRETEFPDTNYLNFLRDNGKLSLEEKQEIIRNKEGISLVDVKAPNMHKPVLPFKTDDKLLFPYGNLMELWIPHNELRFALDRGYELMDIDHMIYTDKSFNPFEDYVNDLFSKRLEYRSENNPSEIIVKLLMNSLYGKFGQKVNDSDGGFYVPVSSLSMDDIGTKTKRIMDEWAIIDPEEKFDRIPGYANPLIASYVTARGRMELYKWFETVEEMGGEVYYCDTDSVYTNIDLDPSDEKILGEMDHEKTVEEMYVFGPKMYVTIDSEGNVQPTMKGVPRNQMMDMWDAIQSGKEEIRYEKIASMREGINGVDYDPNDMIDRRRSADVHSETKRAHISDVDLSSERTETNPYRLTEKFAKEA